ncbi:hypothetical protein CEE84_11400, partial [Lactobacillus crispatus]
MAITILPSGAAEVHGQAADAQDAIVLTVKLGARPAGRGRWRPDLLDVAITAREDEVARQTTCAGEALAQG